MPMFNLIFFKDFLFSYKVCLDELETEMRLTFKDIEVSGSRKLFELFSRGVTKTVSLRSHNDIKKNSYSECGHDSHI